MLVASSVMTFTPGGTGALRGFSVFTMAIPPSLTPWKTLTSLMSVLSWTMM